MTGEESLAAFGRGLSSVQLVIGVIVALVIVLAGLMTGNGWMTVGGIAIAGVAIFYHRATQKSDKFAEGFGAVEGTSLALEMAL